jgi:hypothetical protein
VNLIAVSARLDEDLTRSSFNRTSLRVWRIVFHPCFSKVAEYRSPFPTIV